MLAMNLNQLVVEPTRLNAILDLFFISEVFSSGIVVGPGISDHRLISFCWSSIEHGSVEDHPVKHVKNFDCADDASIIDHLELQFDYQMNNDVHRLWMHFKETVKYCIEHFVPFRKVRSKRYNEWITRDIIQTKRKIKRLRRKKSPSEQHLQSLKQSLECKVKSAKAHYFNVSLPEFIKNDPSKFWRFLGEKKTFPE